MKGVHMNKNDILKEFELKEKNIFLLSELNKLKLENEKLEKEKLEANKLKYNQEGAIEKALRLEKGPEKTIADEIYEGNIRSYRKVLDTYIITYVIYAVIAGLFILIVSKLGGL